MQLGISVRSDIIDSPPTYDNEHSYITVDANYNLSFFTRTLPPVPIECPTPMGVAGQTKLPDIHELVQKLFVREKFKPEPRGTSALFSFYAQHFTHQFFKTDIKRGPQYQWGGHGVIIFSWHYNLIGLLFVVVFVIILYQPLINITSDNGIKDNQTGYMYE